MTKRFVSVEPERWEYQWLWYSPLHYKFEDKKEDIVSGTPNPGIKIWVANRAEALLVTLMLPSHPPAVDAPIELHDKQQSEAYATKVAGDFLAIPGGNAQHDPEGWGQRAEDAAHEPAMQQHHWNLFLLYSAKVFYSGSNTPTANAAIQRIDGELAKL